jgi:hypothetical protein
MTGHDDGVVTIALAEADSAEIEKRRAELAEPYRSLLGHFRHVVGHHYWDILVRDGGKLDQCRAVFGDDSQDYEAALKRHYERSAPADWAERFVSAYATSHPWEDFAETWAHYLHIVDTLETANAFGVRIAPSVDREGRPLHQAQLRPLFRGVDRADHRRLGAFCGRHEQRQSRHGQARSLPVHHRARGRGEAALHSRPRPGRGAEHDLATGSESRLSALSDKPREAPIDLVISGGQRSDRESRPFAAPLASRSAALRPSGMTYLLTCPTPCR